MTQKTITLINDPEGYIIIQFNGDLVKETVDVFKQELADASKFIEQQHHAKGGPVRILLDTTHFTGNYELEALGALVTFAKANKPFVLKTATFGGSDKVRMAGEAAIALSGRTNIHMFKDKVEAVMWLLSQEV